MQRVLVVLAALVAASGVVAATPQPAAAVGYGELASWREQAHRLPVADVVYDHVRDRLWVSVPAIVPVLGNHVVEVHPDTGALGRRVFVGSQPAALALSDDASKLYVASAGAQAVIRVDTASAAADAILLVPSGGSPWFAEDLAVAPGNADRVLVSRRMIGSPRSRGVAVYDVTTPAPLPRPEIGAGNVVAVDDDGRVYGHNTELTSEDIWVQSLTPGGLRVDRAHDWRNGAPREGLGFDIDAAGGRLYGTNGLVLDAGTLEVLGRYEKPGAVEPVPARDRAYTTSGWTLVAYDLDGFVQVGELDLFGGDGTLGLGAEAVALVSTGDGMAITTAAGQLVLVGPAVSPTPPPLPAPPSTVVGAWRVQTTSLRPVALAAGPAGRVLATLPPASGATSGRLVEVDPATGAVRRSLDLGVAPSEALAVSSDGTTAYVGTLVADGWGEIVRVALGSFTVTQRFPVGTGAFDDPVVAHDLAVPPGQPHVVVASLRIPEVSPSHFGTVAYDRGVARPDRLDSGTRTSELAFGPDPGVLYATNALTSAKQSFRIGLGPRGLTLLNEFHKAADFLHFDVEHHAGRLWTTAGLVLEPNWGWVSGRLPAAGPLEVDAAANRVWVAVGGGVVAEIDATTLALVGLRSVPAPGTGLPFALVRTATGLALATTDGLVLLTEGSAPPPPPPPPPPTCRGLAATIVGTGSTITGTAGADVIVGTPGAETIHAGGGNDVVCAGGGNDVVWGGDGADDLDGGAGDDRLRGDGGNDVLRGGEGTDNCSGGDGTDTKTGCE